VAKAEQMFLTANENISVADRGCWKTFFSEIMRGKIGFETRAIAARAAPDRPVFAVGWLRKVEREKNQK
jgi:hypothetical protein